MIIELIHPQIPIGYKKATIIEIVAIQKYLLIRYTLYVIQDQDRPIMFQQPIYLSYVMLKDYPQSKAFCLCELDQ